MIDIEREHAEYQAQRALFIKYNDLYVGGEQFIANGSSYLIARQNEASDVYQERLARVFYENYVGSIIDWYATTLFRREPVILCEGLGTAGLSFYSRFADDCDLRGSTLSDFFRRQLIESLVCRRSYIVVEFPRAETRPRTKAEEEALGISRAYLNHYPALALTNYERNERGEFDWVVLRTERTVAAGSKGEPSVIQRWVRYDRQRFAVYETRSGGDGKKECTLLDEGEHGLATLNRVPVYELGVSDGMWLMNKTASLQLEHFNKSNALSWALTNGLFAMPVVYSERPFEQTVGESYYMQLGPQDRFGWTEPEGHVYEIALRNIDRLKEEIYRVSYLLSQAGGSMSKDSALTGLSKQRDYTITQEVLRGYGDTVKDVIKQVLRAIAAVRGDEVAIDVAGMDEFDVGDFSNELEDAERLLALGINSPTMKTQIFKKLAMKYLCDVRQEVKNQIAVEIDAAR